MSIARVAARIAEQVAAGGDLLYIAADETRAEALWASVASLVGDVVVFVPASDALPGDDAPASPANAGRRVTALRRLLEARETKQRLICITSAEAVARRYPEPVAFAAAPPVFTVGDMIEIAALEPALLDIGYVIDDRIDEPGELAVRGNVIDIFPADAALPVRIELDDGKVVAIRSYDPVTQRTIDDLPHIEVGHANEPAIAPEVGLFAHLKPASLVIEKGVDERRKRFVALASDAARHGRGRSDALSEESWTAMLADWTPLDWRDDAAEDMPRFVERKAPLAALVRYARPLLAEARLVLAGTERDLRFVRPRVARALKLDCTPCATWAEVLATSTASLSSIVMPADAGFRSDDTIVIAAADLLGSRAARDDGAVAGSTTALDGSSEIQLGDVLVHEDHGIAIVRGLETMPGDDAGDALVLEFAGGARRLVPADAADRLWRYGADADAVALDKLDGSSWEQRRATIDAAIAESARALTALAAERAARSAPVIAPDASAYEKFAAGFAFTETADQARAIMAVRADLATGNPMDRLVIGDVGYGKTEVALRAASLVALAGGQVAIAAPTTVLVRQHLEIFRHRFAGSGIVVEGLSRLSSAADRKRVKTGLADGSISVVVGTAAVAGKDAAYSNLQLVVIDEEQRFGAADKAKLRGLHDGHVLTLSATPIPRTLQAALVGLQQLSIIATPPARRQPIRTSVGNWDNTRVRTALMRERARRGQSFVVVPRIEDMDALREKLARIVPELGIVEAHGKMPAADLDEAMIAFADGRGDVLLATNIIEAGLDVPRANTMIVWRADRFGLSQLHQLRGRVGRGGRRGQIFLLTDGDTVIADRTLKRLGTLQAFDRLGAGFAISARDLDMRGAGDLLGDSQTGHMKLIGVDLYQHLLESALRAARGEDVEHWTPDLRMGVAGHLPQDWIPEVELRVSLYARLARITEAAKVDAFEEELEDRFGALPPPAHTLVALARVRVLARAGNVTKIDAGPAAVAFTPRRSIVGWADAGLDESDGRWFLRERIEDKNARVERVAEVLEALIE